MPRRLKKRKPTPRATKDDSEVLESTTAASTRARAQRPSTTRAAPLSARPKPSAEKPLDETKPVWPIPEPKAKGKGKAKDKKSKPKANGKKGAKKRGSKSSKVSKSKSKESTKSAPPVAGLSVDVEATPLAAASLKLSAAGSSQKSSPKSGTGAVDSGLTDHRPPEARFEALQTDLEQSMVELSSAPDKRVARIFLYNAMSSRTFFRAVFGSFGEVMWRNAHPTGDVPPEQVLDLKRFFIKDSLKSIHPILKRHCNSLKHLAAIRNLFTIYFRFHLKAMKKAIRGAVNTAAPKLFPIKMSMKLLLETLGDYNLKEVVTHMPSDMCNVLEHHLRNRQMSPFAAQLLGPVPDAFSFHSKYGNLHRGQSLELRRGGDGRMDTGAMDSGALEDGGVGDSRFEKADRVLGANDRRKMFESEAMDGEQTVGGFKNAFEQLVEERMFATLCRKQAIVDILGHQSTTLRKMLSHSEMHVRADKMVDPIVVRLWMSHRMSEEEEIERLKKKLTADFEKEKNALRERTKAMQREYTVCLGQTKWYSGEVRRLVQEFHKIKLQCMTQNAYIKELRDANKSLNDSTRSRWQQESKANTRLRLMKQENEVLKEKNAMLSAELQQLKSHYTIDGYQHMEAECRRLRNLSRAQERYLKIMYTDWTRFDEAYAKQSDFLLSILTQVRMSSEQDFEAFMYAWKESNAEHRLFKATDEEIEQLIAEWSTHDFERLKPKKMFEVARERPDRHVLRKAGDWKEYLKQLYGIDSLQSFVAGKSDRPKFTLPFLTMSRDEKIATIRANLEFFSAELERGADWVKYARDHYSEIKAADKTIDWDRIRQHPLARDLPSKETLSPTSSAKKHKSAKKRRASKPYIDGSGDKVRRRDDDDDDVGGGHGHGGGGGYFGTGERKSTRRQSSRDSSDSRRKSRQTSHGSGSDRRKSKGRKSRSSERAMAQLSDGSDEDAAPRIEREYLRDSELVESTHSRRRSSVSAKEFFFAAPDADASKKKKTKKQKMKGSSSPAFAYRKRGETTVTHESSESDSEDAEEDEAVVGSGGVGGRPLMTPKDAMQQMHRQPSDVDLFQKQRAVGARVSESESEEEEDDDDSAVVHHYSADSTSASPLKKTGMDGDAIVFEDADADSEEESEDSALLAMAMATASAKSKRVPAVAEVVDNSDSDSAAFEEMLGASVAQAAVDAKFGTAPGSHSKLDTLSSDVAVDEFQMPPEAVKTRIEDTMSPHSAAAFGQGHVDVRDPAMDVTSLSMSSSSDDDDDEDYDSGTRSKDMRSSGGIVGLSAASGAAFASAFAAAEPGLDHSELPGRLRRVDPEHVDWKKYEIDGKWLLKSIRETDIGRMDTDGDNQVSFEEFIAYFDGVPEEVCQVMFDEIDSDGNGQITNKEYFQWRAAINSKRLRSVVERMTRFSMAGADLVRAASTATGVGLSPELSPVPMSPRDSDDSAAAESPQLSPRLSPRGIGSAESPRLSGRFGGGSAERSPPLSPQLSPRLSSDSRSAEESPVSAVFKGDYADESSSDFDNPFEDIPQPALDTTSDHAADDEMETPTKEQSQSPPLRSADAAFEAEAFDAGHSKLDTLDSETAVDSFDIPPEMVKTAAEMKKKQPLAIEDSDNGVISLSGSSSEDMSAVARKLKARGAAAAEVSSDDTSFDKLSDLDRDSGGSGGKQTAAAQTSAADISSVDAVVSSSATEKARKKKKSDPFLPFGGDESEDSGSPLPPSAVQFRKTSKGNTATFTLGDDSEDESFSSGEMAPVPEMFGRHRAAAGRITLDVDAELERITQGDAANSSMNLGGITDNESEDDSDSGEMMLFGDGKPKVEIAEVKEESKEVEEMKVLERAMSPGPSVGLVATPRAGDNSDSDLLPFDLAMPSATVDVGDAADADSLVGFSSDSELDDSEPHAFGGATFGDHKSAVRMPDTELLADDSTEDSDDGGGMPFGGGAADDNPFGLPSEDSEDSEDDGIAFGGGSEDGPFGGGGVDVEEDSVGGDNPPADDQNPFGGGDSSDGGGNPFDMFGSSDDEID